MRIFVLEDNDLKSRAMLRVLRSKGYEVSLARSYREAVDILEREPAFAEMTLDHNLGMDVYSGVDVAEYLATMPVDKRPLRVNIHSDNPLGAREMADVLKAAGIEAVLTPLV